MNVGSQASVLTENELLARFVTCDVWIRNDGTIRADAFIPPKDLNLSVTRHRGISEKALWQIGHNVVATLSEARRCRLEGRADIVAGEVVRQTLSVLPAPLWENANHAHITGWPQDKPRQKQIAQRLAAAAKFVNFVEPV